MNLIKILRKYKVDIIVIIASILVIILGSLLMNWIIPLVMVLIIDLIYFVPYLRKKALIFMKNVKRMSNNKKSTPAHAKGSHAALEKKNNKKLNIAKTRNKKIVKKEKNKKNIWKILLLIILGGFILVVLAIVAFCIYIVIKAPSFDPKELYVSEPSIVYDKDNNEIAKLGSEHRVILEYDELPEVLIDAIVATEDSKFFSHNGVDWARFLKASVLQVLGRSDAGGASTLTMQVSKNTYTSAEASGIKGIIRKFTDVYMSEFKIEPNYSKEEILEFYVNSYYLGNNSYGVEQAALTYFGKSAKDLNLSEAAMIAGLFQAPSKYNPYTNPEATEKRRLTVLNLMKRHGYINDKEYKIAKGMTVEKIVKNNSESNDPSISEYQSFVDVVVAEIEENTGDDPYTTPMKIYTTMDRDKQAHINDIMNSVSYEWENDQVQAGIAVTDINTGAIVAVGGGRNVNAAATLNRATQIKRQIGSTAKPLYDYGPAIEYLNWSTGMPDVDEPITYSDGTKINNWNDQFEGFETIRTALTRSRNIPALKAFQANSKSNIFEFVSKLGLSPEDGLHEAHSIGGYTGESPLSMAAAYSAFGNGGYYTEPYSYTKIEYTLEDKEVENKKEKTQVMKDSTAYMVADMLVDTGQYALGRWANINGKTYGAKTGTSNFDEATKKAFGLPGSAVNDLWVVGFNPEYAIGVWYGYDKTNSEHYNLLSSGQHERLFQAVARGIFTSNDSFKKPDSVSEVTIETECPTPMLPSEYTPDSLKKTELFVKGHEPTEVSPRFAKLNDTTNVKASASGSTVTLSWNAVEVPQINTDSYLKSYFKDTFRSTEYLNSFVNSRLNYISSTMGSFGYSIYKKESTGSLTYLGFTNQTTYNVNANNGSNTYVVKTSYSNFKSTESNGKSVTVNVSSSSSPTTPIEPSKPDEEITVNASCSKYGNDLTINNSGMCVDSTSQEVGSACPDGYKYDSAKKVCTTS